MSSVFISGVAGFLGSHLAEHLIRQNISVVGCDSLMHGGDRRNVPQGVEFHHLDVREFSSLAPLLKNVERVFHAACLGHDGLSINSPFLISENMYSATASLVSAAARARVKRFVYCSSMARYGGVPSPFVEDMECHPVTPYGVTKLACENLVRAVAGIWGMEWAVCVPHNIIGPRQKCNDPYRNVVAIMMNRLLQGQAPLIFGDGEQRRCFSPIDDIVGILQQMLFAPQAAGQIVNVGPDAELITINELHRRIGKALGINIAPLHVPARPREVNDANCSAEKARRLFGYRTCHDLDQSLVKMAEWMRAAGPEPFRFNLPLEIADEGTPKHWLSSSFYRTDEKTDEIFSKETENPLPNAVVE